MARFARGVIPGIPHHVLQRGNRKLKTFFREQDYQEYLKLMREWGRKAGVEFWAYCLMPNHVHLIAVPKKKDSFRLGIAEAHRRYTRYINFRRKWRGHLWQERFHSYPMDEKHLYEAARYRWSSAKAHLERREDPLVNIQPLLDRVGNWSEYLREGLEKDVVGRIERHLGTGRPLGSESFMRRLERKTGRVLRPQKPGRPKNKK